MRYDTLSREALQAEYDVCLSRYETCKSQGLALNMSRGKPNTEQLSLSDCLPGILSPADCLSEDGTDCRNYGGADGLPEMKRLFAALLAVSPEEVIVGGNSSLNMMFDAVAALIQKAPGWRDIQFICPVPGYDRHFAICEYFSIPMRTVPMTPDGPDMDAVEQLAADKTVSGMWCVPVFSNPQGYIYSDKTIERLAAMKTAHPHFRLLWDNAYAVHHFRGTRPQPLNILRACEKYNHADRPLLFTSFSKISHAGSAVAGMAASKNNRAFHLSRITAQTVGPDKMNQLRHVRYFKNLDGVLAHMDKHARILRPKFELAEAMLERELRHTGEGEWFCPDGGYFISFNTPCGCAKRTVALCREAGVILTDAGATYPYQNDPADQNIRLAPSYLSLDDLAQALTVFCAAVRLAALEKRLSLNGGAAHA